MESHSLDTINPSPIDQVLPPIIDFQSIIASEQLRRAIDHLGFQIPTPVQAQAIPRALAGKDLIIQAKTGSGKTLAYLVPLLNELERILEKVTTPFGLIVTPTRELALQVEGVLSSLTSNIAPVCLIGGMDIDRQIAALERDPRIVIGTPGRILDLIRQRILKLRNCRYFVLDEADEMLSMGFLEDIRAILSRLPDERQGLFVSATITPRVDMLANAFLTKPENISVDSPYEDLPPIEHFYCEVGGDILAKPTLLCDLIEVLCPRSAIIFCNTKSDTQLVEVLLRRRGFDARRINSDLTQAQRNRIMEKIRAHELRFLVATDIAARGLDLDQIDFVINYSIHDQAELYIHRTGRTGRAGKTGQAISLVGPRDFTSFHHLTKILDLDFKKMPLPSEDSLAAARLVHLYEILRQSRVELKQRDLLVARKLVLELNPPLSPGNNEIQLSEEFESIIAKLCRYTAEHYVSDEAQSLEEELEAEERQDPRKRHHRDDEEADFPRQRDRRPYSQRQSDQRGSSQSQQRGPREREEEQRQPRQNEQRRDSRSERDDFRRPQQDRREPRRDGPSTQPPRDHRPDSREPRERARPRERNESSSTRQRQIPEKYRCYIGQGIVHGMTEEVFIKLACELAELTPKNLYELVIREYYGFVDVFEPHMKSLIENINGIEYSGFPLPIEVATIMTDRRPRRDGQEG